MIDPRSLLDLVRELWRAFVVWADPGEHGRG